LLPSCRRNIASSAARLAEPGSFEEAQISDAAFPEEGSEGDSGFEEPSWHRMNSAEMLEAWLEGDGAKFKTPMRPNNWLGGHVPFPLNQSFKPPRPVDDELRTKLYRQFMTDPKTNNVRTLAGRNNLSMQRTDAILRLKGLEEHWKENKKPLQTGFLAGMEWCLGVRDHVMKARRSEVENDHSRYDVTEADALMEAEANDPARLRYQKMFWEAVPDGQDPVVPLLLEQARADGKARRREGEESKSRGPFLRPQENQGMECTDKVKMVAPAGRPMIKFVDVGGKFIDKHDRLARIKRWKHKGMLKQKKQEKNRAAREEELNSRIAAKEAVLAAKALKKTKPKWEQGSGGRDLVFS
jgi:hypothetical protein